MYQADVLPHTRRPTMTFVPYGGNRITLTAIISGALLHYRTLPGRTWPVGTCTQDNFCDRTSLTTGRASGLHYNLGRKRPMVTPAGDDPTFPA